VRKDRRGGLGVAYQLWGERLAIYFVYAESRETYQ
jgi:hypothetical protein